MKKTLEIFVLIGILMFVSAELAMAATGTERSDPYFRELNQLRQKLGNVERRVGGVERGLKTTNETVNSLAGQIGQKHQTTVDNLVFGSQPEVIYVTFEGSRSSVVSLAVRAAVKKYTAAGYTIREVVQMPSDLRDEAERDILDADRKASLAKEFGKVRLVTTYAEMEGLKRDGVVGGLVVVDPPKPKVVAPTAPTP